MLQRSSWMLGRFTPPWQALRLLRQMVLDALDQPIHVAMKVRIRTHGDPIPVRNPHQRGGQVGFFRHVGAAYQHRNDGNIALEGCLELDSHEIFRIVEAVRGTGAA